MICVFFEVKKGREIFGQRSALENEAERCSSKKKITINESLFTCVQVFEDARGGLGDRDLVSDDFGVWLGLVRLCGFFLGERF